MENRITGRNREKRDATRCNEMQTTNSNNDYYTLTKMRFETGLALPS
jgi:hypothetical protein